MAVDFNKFLTILKNLASAKQELIFLNVQN